ncbi:MAG: hypothetical protein WCI92_13500 [Bacteroidota bacterium]
MERLIYREEQSFRQSFVIWIMLATWLIVFGTFGYGLYQQLYLGKPFGGTPESDKGLLWSGLISILVMSAVFIFILCGNLVTEIWTDGIRFKFPPLIRKMKHIPISEIASAEVTKYRPISEFGGWGWRKRFISGKTAYNISGRIGIRVIKKNGKQVMFGTIHQDEMKRAVEKMMQGNGK